MADKKKSFPLRIDPKIYAALERWSQDELRSVNAHIEYLLREALKQTGRLPYQQKDVNESQSIDL